MDFMCYVEAKEEKYIFFACPGGSLSPPPAFLPNSPCFPAAFDLSTHPPTTEQCYAAIDDCMKKGNVWRKSHFLKSLPPVHTEEFIIIINYCAALLIHCISKKYSS